MFIIVEGLDNTGKSTMIQNLKNSLNDISFHAMHYSAVKQNTPEETIQYSKKLYHEMFQLMNYTSQIQKSGIICDRSHLGEMVYGPIYRNYTGEYVLDIEKEYEHMPFWDDVFLITCYDNPENLLKRDDGLSFTTNFQKKQEEINNFLNAHNKSNIKNKLTLNIEFNNEHKALNRVLEFVKTRKGN